MSTICCMLHLFGSGLGQNGSTRYFGGVAARCCALTTTTTMAPRTTVITRRRFFMAPLYTSCPQAVTGPAETPESGLFQANFRWQTPCRDAVRASGHGRSKGLWTVDPASAKEDFQCSPGLSPQWWLCSQ